jgi:pilus assembly protein CpaF
MNLIYELDGKKMEFAVGVETPVRIGRNPDVELHIPDTNVSREHCVISYGDGDYHITDLKSKNGTYVNGAKTGHTILHAGDRIEIGSVVLTVQPDSSKGPSTMIREIEGEMQQKGKGYGTILREIVEDA